MWDTPFNHAETHESIPELDDHGVGFWFLEAIEHTHDFILRIRLSNGSERGDKTRIIATVECRPVYFAIADEYIEDQCRGPWGKQVGPIRADKIFDSIPNEGLGARLPRSLRAFFIDATDRYIMLVDTEKPTVTVTED